DLHSWWVADGDGVWMEARATPRWSEHRGAMDGIVGAEMEARWRGSVGGGMPWLLETEEVRRWLIRWRYHHWSEGFGTLGSGL
ncbi:hypothetical protein U1Q18_026249, partial [Sarracenia purpurea var. burkii]